MFGLSNLLSRLVRSAYYLTHVRGASRKSANVTVLQIDSNRPIFLLVIVNTIRKVK